MTKPLITYISGAPGSGKTTLAKLIAERLYLPSISSDLIHGGVGFCNPDHDRMQTLNTIFVPLMIDMSQKGISFVVDQVFQKGLSETDIIDRLRPHADIVNIHTVCANPIERYIARISGSDQPDIIQRRQQLLERAAVHRDNLSVTNEPLELGSPLLVVNTDDGYDPGLDEIITFVQANRPK